MNEFELTYPANHLNFEQCVSSGQVFRWERQDDGRWIGVDGDHWFWVTLPESESTNENRRTLTHLTGANQDRSRDALAFVGERRAGYGQRFETMQVRSNGLREDLERFFRLDWDADQLEKRIVELAPEMEPYMGAMSGLRLLRPSGPTEMFFGFMCSPNNNLPRIVQMVRYLATLGPVMADLGGKPLHRFPSTETIAAVDPLSLRAKAFGYRADTIPSVARQVMDRGGDPWIQSLKSKPYEEVHATLCEIKGIGPKLADCISLFALDLTDAVPVDTHVWQAAVRLYFPEWKDKPLTDVRYRQVSDLIRGKFGPLSGWAHQFLFYDNMLNWRSRR
jgi:N-glycosylase/DNA lyase